PRMALAVTSPGSAPKTRTRSSTSPPPGVDAVDPDGGWGGWTAKDGSKDGLGDTSDTPRARCLSPRGALAVTPWGDRLSPRTARGDITTVYRFGRQPAGFPA